MFKIFNENMQEIKFPDGVIPKEIFVGSIAKERNTESVDGRSGVVNYGFNYISRPIELYMWIKSKDHIDYRLARNDLYALLDTGSVMYVAEDLVPSRVLKIVVDDTYIPNRWTEEYAEVEINCTTIDSVFWESTYTTLELHDSGYTATAEKYGLVDNIDDEKVKYRFEPSIGTIDLSGRLFDYGFINATGAVSQVGTGSYTFSLGFIDLIPGVQYEFVDEGDHPRLRYWWIYEYDANENFIERIALNSVGDGRQHTFTAKGSKLKLMINPIAPVDENTIPPSRVGIDVLPKLKTTATTQRFTLWNAGNVAVEPESMRLIIQANFVRSPKDFTIKNLTTGEIFIMRRSANGNHLRLNGMVVSLGGLTNIFRDTNHQFISLAPGNNQFEITGGAFAQIWFDFKFLYK